MSKAYKGLGMEGRVAQWYAANTAKSLDEYRKAAIRVAAELAPGDRVLEVAPGPGYFAIELAKLGSFRVEGLDISRTFVEIAARNASKANVDVGFRQGNAAAIPYAGETFDYIFCRAAFKNFAEPAQALEEMRRVLKPGGKGMLVDLRKDAPREAIAQEVGRMGLSPLNQWITRLTFRFMLLKRAYTEEQLRALFARVPFRAVEFRTDAIGLEIHFER